MTPSPLVHLSSLEVDLYQSEACLVHSVRWSGGYQWLSNGHHMVTKSKVIIWNSESWLIGSKGYFLGDAVSSKEEQQVEERTPFSSSTMTERYIYAFHHQPAWELVKSGFHWAVHYWVPPVHTCDRWRLRRWHTSGSSQHPTEARAPTFHRPSCEFTQRHLTRSQLIPRQIYNEHILIWKFSLEENQR